MKGRREDVPLLPLGHQRPLVSETWRKDREPSCPPFAWPPWTGSLISLLFLLGPFLGGPYFHDDTSVLLRTPPPHHPTPHALPGATQFSFCPASYTHSQPFSMAWIRGHLDRSVAFTFLLICSPLIWGSTELPPGTMDHCSGWVHLAHSPDTPNQGAVLTQRVPADSFSNL